jgi:hypothetical protein
MTDSTFTPAQPTGMQPIADDLRAAAKAYRKGIYRDVSPDHLADTFDRIASSIEAAQPPAAPVETKPFYGAQCPTYPNCSGGCGLGCTHEVKQHQSCSAATEAVAWQFTDDRYPYIKGIVTDRQRTVEAWREGDIKFVGLGPITAVEPQTFGNAVLETTSNMAAAVENLARHQEQCDMDGVMVKVSRQALDEVLSGVEAINSFACAVSRPVLLRDEEAGK